MKKVIKNPWFWTVAVVTALVMGSIGCGGYQVRMSVPDHIQRVAVPNFVNATQQPGIEEELSRKVREIFIVDGRLIVSDADKADAVLEGTIQRYDRLVLTRDQNQVPQQYKLQLAVDLDFTDKKTGERLWTTRRIVILTPGQEESEKYDSTNYRSLKVSTTFYVLNNIGMPPEDETIVRQRLLEEMADRVYRRVMDGF